VKAEAYQNINIYRTNGEHRMCSKLTAEAKALLEQIKKLAVLNG
jgi:hypothetical protein